MFSSIEEQNNIKGRLIPLDRVLNRKQVLYLTNIGQTNMYEQIKNDTFPKPIEVSPGRKGWIDAEIQQWIEDRKAARDV